MKTTRNELARPGKMTHDILGHRVSSRFILKENDLPFGVVALRPKENNTSVIPADKDGIPLGITIAKDLNIEPCNDGCERKGLELPYGNDDKSFWNKNACISVLEQGSVIVRVFEDVKQGDAVKFTTSGDATADADGNAKLVGMCGANGVELKGAVYEQDAKAFECTIVRINK